MTPLGNVKVQHFYQLNAGPALVRPVASGNASVNVSSVPQMSDIEVGRALTEHPLARLAELMRHSLTIGAGCRRETRQRDAERPGSSALPCPECPESYVSEASVSQHRTSFYNSR